MQKSCSNFVYTYQGSKDKIFENFEQNDIFIDTKPYTQHKNLFSNLLMFKLKFQNIISTKLKLSDKEYYYNMITVYLY